jgi:hypothetical protein
MEWASPPCTDVPEMKAMQVRDHAHHRHVFTGARKANMQLTDRIFEQVSRVGMACQRHRPVRLLSVVRQYSI